MKKISVIIPLYNAEDFIERAYNFLNQQTVKLPLEIIMVDNNSEDASLSLAKNISKKDKRVKVFTESKQGAPAARNTGFKNSTGDFIYFFDVDDQLFDDTLESLAQVLIDYKNVEAVFGKMLKSHEHITEINRNKLEETNKIILKEKPYWGLLWFKDLSTVVGPPAFMYRRSTFKKLGMYNEAIPASEDTALDIDLGMTCNIAKLDKYVYLYYKHSQATTTVLKNKKSRVFLQWPRLIKSHLPFYINNSHEIEYGEILKNKLYSSIPKMIYRTKGKRNRQKLKNKLIKEIKPLQLPKLLNLYLNLLVVFPNEYVLKFYLYYLKPRFVE